MDGEIFAKFYSQGLKNVVGVIAEFIGCLHSV